MPFVHSRHVVAPVEFWYVPGAQGVHLGERRLLVKVPGAHSVGVVEAVEQKWPTGQALQCASVERAGAFEYEPAGQGNRADAPRGQ